LDQGGYAAANLCSGAMVPLPNLLRIPSEHGWVDTKCEHRMVIHTVTFSGTPLTEGFLAAAHVSSASSIAFWRTGMNGHWIGCRHDMDVIEDIIYYKEGFHVLSSTEDVVVYAPNAVSGHPLVMSRTSYLVQKRADYKPNSHLPYTHSMSRYLVESRGKLLMILRLFRPKRRREFRIFEMNLAAGGSKASWEELHALPGRVLLLGRGCSRAFEVSQFDRLQVGNIYYLDDDTSFDLSSALSNGSRHSSTYMGGVYDFHKKCNKRRRFPRKFTLEYSLPIWFIP
jgi:hypothetical protein